LGVEVAGDAEEFLRGKFDRRDMRADEGEFLDRLDQINRIGRQIKYESKAGWLRADHIEFGWVIPSEMGESR
jgi:hypothetical protein